jgi:hypothetical protein
LYDPLLLYEREKFFEFVQAGLRAGSEFHATPLVLGRCRKLLAGARKGWLALRNLNSREAGALEIAQFLQALGDAANTVAELNGGPLSERRLLLDFPARAQAAECQGCVATLFNLLGAGQVDAATLLDWLPAWKTAFLSAAENARVEQRVHAARLNYYDKAIQALLAGETPLAGLWPLLGTWTLAVSVLDDPFKGPWREACRQLGFEAPAFDQRLSGLDAFVDEIELRLDQIAAANGLETSTSF